MCVQMQLQRLPDCCEPPALHHLFFDLSAYTGPDAEAERAFSNADASPSAARQSAVTAVQCSAGLNVYVQGDGV